MPVALVEKYGSKMRRSASGSMPVPVSVNDSYTRPPSPSATMLSDPVPGIACSAFSMMFVMARASSVRSTTTMGRDEGTSVRIVMRPARPVTYGSTKMAIRSDSAVRVGRGGPEITFEGFNGDVRVIEAK